MSFRQTLKEHLNERMQRNPKYSLRAFARDLKISSARLSEILSEKKGLSRPAAAQLASRLGMSPEETVSFCDQVEAEHARGQVARQLAKQRLKQRKGLTAGQRLDLDTFKAVASWEHLAILELMRLPDYQDDVSWIAAKMDQKPLQVELVLERLEKLGLCEWKDGRRVPTERGLHSPEGIPSDAVKQYHVNMLDRAKDALYFQGLEERDFFSYVLTLAEEDLSEVRARIRKLIGEIDRDFGGKKTSRKVFQVGSQLFALTK